MLAGIKNLQRSKDLIVYIWQKFPTPGTTWNFKKCSSLTVTKKQFLVVCSLFCTQNMTTWPQKLTKGHGANMEECRSIFQYWDRVTCSNSRNASNLLACNHYKKGCMWFWPWSTSTWCKLAIVHFCITRILSQVVWCPDHRCPSSLLVMLFASLMTLPLSTSYRKGMGGGWMTWL